MKKAFLSCLLIFLVIGSISGCSTVSERKNTGMVVGGVAGGIAGSALTHGSPAGAIAGAVGGGLVGRAVTN